MKKFVGIVMTASMVLALMTGCSVNTETSETDISETTAVDLGPARAQDDYYRYVNQERFDNAEFEYGHQSIEMAFDQQMINDQIEGIIDDVAAGSGYVAGSEEDIISRAYNYYLDYDFENEEIPADLMAMIESIDNASSVDELLDIDAVLVRDYGMNGVLLLGPSVNPFEPTEMVLEFHQIPSVLNTSFTSIRDENYALDYLRSDAQVIMSTRGYDTDTAEEYGTELAYLALDLYNGTDLSIQESTGMGYEFKKILSADEIHDIMTNIDIDGYLTTIGIDASQIDSYCLSDEGQLQALNDIWIDENLDALKAWELGNLYSDYSEYIAPHYSQLVAYTGRDYSSEHDQAVSAVQYSFKSETDPIYVERYYTPEMDSALISMCDDIREGYRTLISGAEWLSEDTRAELLRKLDNIVYVTGTNLERHDPADYADVVGDNYYELYISYQKHNTQEVIASLNKPVSRTEVGMDMQDFNACYDPSLNNITITVAITNAPFFDVNADYYTNLGGLGMVIAHEMGHAFDSNCIVFDSNGVYDPSWIPDDDMNTLVERNAQAVTYFEDNFTVFGVYHVDGDQTLGENYADLGAMECITSLTNTDEDRMLLFESYATIWCEMETDEAIIDQIAYDVHSPALVRVNAVLSTVDAFYETYDVQEGDGMYIAPENRISRWY